MHLQGIKNKLNDKFVMKANGCEVARSRFRSKLKDFQPLKHFSYGIV